MINYYIQYILIWNLYHHNIDINIIRNQFCGGIVGGFDKFTVTFGAFNFDGIGPVAGTRLGCYCLILDGWLGILPGLFIEVAFPGLLLGSPSVFLWVCEGGAYAVKDIIFYPLTIKSPRVLFILFWTPVFLDLTTLY